MSSSSSSEGKLLWKPSNGRVTSSNIFSFVSFINLHQSRGGYPPLVDYLQSPKVLHDWSVQNIPAFWSSFLEFSGIIYSKKYTSVLGDGGLDKFPGTEWFPGMLMNFAENLMRHCNDSDASTHPAIHFVGESNQSSYRTLTYSDLKETVSKLAHSLRTVSKCIPGDRVAAFAPNTPETLIAMLAATSVGCVWASCGAELQAAAVIDRFSQIEPKVLFSADEYYYKGTPIDIINPKLTTVVDSLGSLSNVVISSYLGNYPLKRSLTAPFVPWDEFLSLDERPLIFEQLPFSHPVYVMFSSGTTGKPKCMVQSGGGVLINHLKELSLSADLKKKDIHFYITAPSWMMWNWLVSSLALGTSVFLYDGNPLYPTPLRCFELIDRYSVTHFGVSASFIHYLLAEKISPRSQFHLRSLKTLLQTASSMSPEGFEYCYREIKSDLFVNSISGGTDLNGCFAGALPIFPVYSGMLQGKALAMKIASYDDSGNPVMNQQGELVCEAPFPSAPIYFWGDDQRMTKYKKAYFDHFQERAGKNVWRQGDFIHIRLDCNGGITFWGRSDAVLKPSGVRIGTSEIYNVVEQIPEIQDSLAIGQKWKGDQRIILFVVLTDTNTPSPTSVDPKLCARIRSLLRTKCSPRHVPSVILPSPDIPYTFSNKKVEMAITGIIHGIPPANKGALRNPESLDFFEKITPYLKAPNPQMPSAKL